MDENCDCFVCKNYSKAYVKYQLSQEEAVGYRLATFHNLYYLQRLMEQARVAIKQGKFLEFKNKTKKIYEKADKSVRSNKK